jgi:hypothetical protein
LRLQALKQEHEYQQEQLMELMELRGKMDHRDCLKAQLQCQRERQDRLKLQLQMSKEIEKTMKGMLSSMGRLAYVKRCLACVKDCVVSSIGMAGECIVDTASLPWNICRHPRSCIWKIIEYVGKHPCAVSSAFACALPYYLLQYGH